MNEKTPIGLYTNRAPGRHPGDWREALAALLSIAPGSGEAMSGMESLSAGRDMKASLGAGNYSAAASDALRSLTAGLGAIPVFGVLARGSGKAAKALGEIVPAAARKLGFDKPVFHGSQARLDWMNNAAIPPGSTEAITTLKGHLGGLKLADGLGVHTGTATAAAQRLEKYHGVKFGERRLPPQLEPILRTFPQWL